MRIGPRKSPKIFFSKTHAWAMPLECTIDPRQLIPAGRVPKFDLAEPKVSFPKPAVAFWGPLRYKYNILSLCITTECYALHTLINIRLETFCDKAWEAVTPLARQSPEARGWELATGRARRSCFWFLYMEKGSEWAWRQCFCTNKFKKCLVGTFFSRSDEKQMEVLLSPIKYELLRTPSMCVNI